MNQRAQSPSPSSTPPGRDAARVVSVPVAAPAEVVYRFARSMPDLPLWASGLATGILREGGLWFSESPMGRVRIDMAPTNAFGVLDHDVTLPDGSTTHNAFRVSPVGAEAAMLSFVVLRAPGASDADFARDVEHVGRDLRTLAALMEKGADRPLPRG